MSTSVLPTLTALRAQLATVAGVVTCKIGLEANMTPADYPMVRIVPSTIKYGTNIGQRAVECLIYFGMPAHEFTAGLEALYAQLLALEAAIITAAASGGSYYWQYLETITDEDRVDGYKLMAIRAVVDG